LTAGSLGIEKIQQNRFLGGPGGFLGLIEVIQPADAKRHINLSSSGRSVITLWET
jgi:hypothetical protein